jgi:hypothetical protein
MTRASANDCRSAADLHRRRIRDTSSPVSPECRDTALLARRISVVCNSRDGRAAVAPQKRVPFFIHIDEFQGVAPCIALSAPQAAGIRMRSWRR